MSDTDAFSPLDDYCYILEASTDDGIQGWALIDSDGELEVFAESRRDVLYYAAAHEIQIVKPN